MHSLETQSKHSKKRGRWYFWNLLETEVVEKYVSPQKILAVQLWASRGWPPATLWAEPPGPALPDRLWQEVAWGGHATRLAKQPGWPSLGRKQNLSPGLYGGGSGVPACSTLGLLCLPQATLWQMLLVQWPCLVLVFVSFMRSHVQRKL